MDFAFSEEQEALRELARQILADRATPERLRELEAGEWFDRELWAELAKANLLGAALPEDVGGSGLGLLELCLVLEEVGRHVAPVPLLPTLALAALPLAEFGSEGQRRRFLPAVASGDLVLSAALQETGAVDPTRPRAIARRDGSGWRLEGEKVCVPAAALAARVLLAARTGEAQVGVFLVDPSAAGVALEPQRATNREPLSRLALDGARVAEDDVLGDPHAGASIVQWTVERALLGLCALQVGVAEEALRRTAEYASQRRQFGRPIASFQGVALRAADAYIDVEAMRSTLWQAAWRLSAGLPAEREVRAAKWWACRGGLRVAHTAQHLHGGIGSDVEYPIHRYFLWARQLELTLGAAGPQLARLGALLAAGGAEARP